MFYERLKELCKQKGTTVTTVVKELGMSTGNISKWKNGNKPKADSVSALAEYLGVSTVWDEPGDYFKITIAYNLTSLPTKTYRLQKGGTLSDLERTAPVVGTNPTIHGCVVVHTIHREFKPHQWRKFTPEYY